MIQFNNLRSIDLRNSSQFFISKYKKAYVTLHFFLNPPCLNIVQIPWAKPKFNAFTKIIVLKFSTNCEKNNSSCFGELKKKKIMKMF